MRDQKPFVSTKYQTNPTANEIFLKARSLERTGRYEEARKAYYQAKDLDALRFRAPEEFNEILHQLGNEFNVPVVPLKSYFETASTNGFIGNNLTHEHLHPNKDGYFLMADAFYNTIRRENLISLDWQERYIKPSAYYQQSWGFSQLDSVYAALSIAHLKGGWPFRTDQRPNIAFDIFRPTTKADSISLYILKTGKSTLELGHIELAQQYERKRDFEHAFQEYRALIYTVPHLDIFYEPTINLLINLKQYEQALFVLYEGIKFNKSAFIQKWIGQLHLILDETERGIYYLENARKLTPQDTILLFNLCRAYYKLSKTSNGDEILRQLNTLKPNSDEVQNLIAYKKTIQNDLLKKEE